MAIIASTLHEAEVSTQQQSYVATMSMSGALMEMLSTVYKHILLAAIREPIQNGCDTVRRKGMKISDGVTVQLPTVLNPMVTIIDRGEGMSDEFMRTKYLSFGTSTKEKSANEAGGLGVGRWAAYGYIRECYTTTCTADDMVARTYFQYTGPDGKPNVVHASSTPGTEVGTKVQFPIKESDIQEAYKAVAWLKEIMQLTLGDSFTVEGGHLPSVLPSSSGFRFDLEEVDPMLKGVAIYPMESELLQYGEKGSLSNGSLVVLTNQEVGVGGLPFHVNISREISVFKKGMIIEIPISMKLPFLPSREELKYTDEVYELFSRIDKAALRALFNKLRDLMAESTLSAYSSITKLIGTVSNKANMFQDINGNSAFSDELKEVLGTITWLGNAPLRAPSLPVKLNLINDVNVSCSLKEANAIGGYVHHNLGPKLGWVSVSFDARYPIYLVANDVQGGISRIRKWANTHKRDNSKILIVSEKSAGDALLAVNEINAYYKHSMLVVKASDLPALPKEVKGPRPRKMVEAAITRYNFALDKQEAISMSLLEPSSDFASQRVWIGKQGGKLSGHDSDHQLGTFINNGLHQVFKKIELNHLYLLSPKEEKMLNTLIADATSVGAFDDDYCFDDSDYTKEEINGLKSWVRLDEIAISLFQGDTIQNIVKGEFFHTATAPSKMTQLCTNLAEKPRLELSGSTFDFAISSHCDILTGEIKMFVSDHELKSVCEFLTLFAESAEESYYGTTRAADIDNFKALKDVGIIRYDDLISDLLRKYPLLAVAMTSEYWNSNQATKVTAAAWDDFWKAFSVIYK